MSAERADDEAERPDVEAPSVEAFRQFNRARRAARGQGKRGRTTLQADDCPGKATEWSVWAAGRQVWRGRR